MFREVALLFGGTNLPKEDNQPVEEGGDPHIDSLYGVWPAADWQEREVFDLFGVVFDGHPDLRRIMLPADFEGHPLRKDYDNPNMIRRPDYI